MDSHNGWTHRDGWCTWYLSGEGGTHVSHVTEQFVAISSGTDDSSVVEAPTTLELLSLGIHPGQSQ